MQDKILHSIVEVIEKSPFRETLNEDTAITGLQIVGVDNLPYPYVTLSDGRIFCPFRPLSGNKKIQ